MSLEMMTGTGGTPDFVVVGRTDNESLPHIKVGVRPLFAISGSFIGDGPMHIEINYRIRYQVANGSVTPNVLKSLIDYTELKGGCKKKQKLDYASYMLENVLTAKIAMKAATLQQLRKAKDMVRQRAGDLFDIITQSATHIANDREKFIAYMLNALQKEGTQVGLDFGDITELKVPQDQPIFKTYENKQKGMPNPSSKTGGKLGKIDPVGGTMGAPKQPVTKDVSVPDFTPAQDPEDTEEDLKNLSFDELMKKIGKPQ